MGEKGMQERRLRTMQRNDGRVGDFAMQQWSFVWGENTFGKWTLGVIVSSVKIS